MPAVVVLAHALRYFSQRAVSEVSDQSATPLGADDIRWVVTVPAIWTAAAKQLMRQAAYDVSTVRFLFVCLFVCRPINKPESVSQSVSLYAWLTS